MSDYIPFHLQVEIIIKLPVKSLIRCRSLSKAWKSLIDSSEFIADHRRRQTQPERLFVMFTDPATLQDGFVSYIDDDTFPHQNFDHYSVKPLIHSRVVGSSHGLVCLYGYYSGSHHAIYKNARVVLWNPSIRKQIVIVVPGVFIWRLEPDLGFGVHPVTLDPMIVKMTKSDRWKAMVYTLSSGKWRSLSINLPSSVVVIPNQVVIDGFIYWYAIDMIITDNFDIVYFRHLILSFDMTNENFIVIDIPETLVPKNLVPQPHVKLAISKLMESLIVLEYDSINGEKHACGVWMMEHGGQRSFTKLYTISVPYLSVWDILGFSKSGQPIMGMKYDSGDQLGLTSLVAYEPNSQHISYLQILAKPLTLFVNSCIETLLLLDR